ncbi:hypothetical protein NDU88_006712 [Pleurodeles waltl]|uniref:Uncharacterized protein n=1 Tax=Pleurodeles waltl TaxID=8319 RepID=A0AAV7N009_PLEWA|nr:hypothetical protein NDU88_006712 [Pleurodeles waltl]
MAAPSGPSMISIVSEDMDLEAGGEDRDAHYSEDIIVVLDSDDEVERGNDYDRDGGSKDMPASEWEVSNQSILRAGELVEFVDEHGTVIRGTICVAARDDGMSGMAQVRLDFWQQGERAYHPGCDDAHVLGGHETAEADQRLGRPAVFDGLVEVGAPPGHRVEEGAQPGAVRLTPREVSVREGGYSDTNLSGIRSIPASQGATSGLSFEEEALDYEEEDTDQGAQPVAVAKATTSRRAVQGDRLAGSQKDLSGNLLRGEVPNESGLVGASFGNKGVVLNNTRNVDVAFQVEAAGGHRRWFVLAEPFVGAWVLRCGERFYLIITFGFGQVSERI